MSNHTELHQYTDQHTAMSCCAIVISIFEEMGKQTVHKNHVFMYVYQYLHSFTVHHVSVIAVSPPEEKAVHKTCW